MPERSFFDLRYAIPGYSFIIWILGINHVPLLALEVFELESAFGAFLALLTLLGGSPIGFLVSQWWWWSFQRKVKEYDDFEASVQALRKKYGVIKPEEKEGKKKVLTIHDYVIHSEKNDRIHEYNARRWDMYHLFSSERVAIRLATLCGFLYRFLYQDTHVYIKDILTREIDYSTDNLVSFLKAEGWVQVCLIFLWLAMDFVLLRQGYEYVKFQLCAMTKATINKSSLRREDLEGIFSLDCFDITIIGIDEKVAEQLRRAGIDSVAKLAKHNSKDAMEKIRAVFSEGKTQISEKDISNWVRRATWLENMYGAKE